MTNPVLGFFAPWLVYAGILGLHVVLPARSIEGYAIDERGERLRYRINGLLTLAVSLAIWAIAGYSGVLPWDWLWQHRWWGAAGACVLGVLLSLAAMAWAPSTGRSFVAQYFFGRAENPRLLGGRADAKMVLYLVGAILLELNLLSFVAHHVLAYPGDPSPGVILYAALLTWFVVDYLVFERVHLYTYDLFAERVGFKLIWGCLAWYPWFYCVGLWAVAALPNPGAPAWLLVLASLTFFAGWTLARGANMQKYAFKRDPGRPFLERFPQTSISDGRRRLLCGGFWGVSRHVNYLGEVLMATGLALALGRPSELGPWLYPLYYLLLLVPRERDDDRRCAAKYGELWERYRERVPWRIVPRLY